jgi:NitT/TauT family transport system substrate-binding protein
MKVRGSWAALLFAVAAGVCVTPGFGQTVMRVGAFPNITHPQAMVGKNEGWFEKALGNSVKIEWKSFNAGPSAIEALFAGALDITYIGPNPAITGYVRSQGEALRIVAGAFKNRKTFTVSVWLRRKWATRKTWPCAHGSKHTA